MTDDEGSGGWDGWSYGHASPRQPRRTDQLQLVGDVTHVKYLPDDDDAIVRAAGTYLRVPLRPITPCSAAGWLVQLTHSEAGKESIARSYRQGTRRRGKLLCAAVEQGRKAAASMRGSDAAPIPLVSVTMGDQNFTAQEVNNLTTEEVLMRLGVNFVASEGVVDKQGRLHQDILIVGAHPGVSFKPEPCHVKGFDEQLMAVRARLRHDPVSDDVGAASAGASTLGDAAPADGKAGAAEGSHPLEPRPFERGG